MEACARDSCHASVLSGLDSRLRRRAQRAARGEVRRRRSSAEADADRSRRGAPTLDERFGGVPNARGFASSLPHVLSASRHNNANSGGPLRLFFPQQEGRLPAPCRAVVAWFCLSSKAEPPPARGEHLTVAPCEETGWREASVLVREGPPGQWRRSGGTERWCTGRALVTITLQKNVPPRARDK